MNQIIPLEQFIPLQQDYQQALTTLTADQRELRGVKREIGKQVAPLVPFMTYLRTEGVTLGTLLDRQSQLVSHIGDTLEEMATSCEADKARLLEYVDTLEERSQYCAGEHERVSKVLAAPNSVEGLVANIRAYVEQASLTKRQQHIGRRSQVTRQYIEHVSHLVPVITDIHCLFSSGAETMRDWSTHLEATNEAYAKLITLGKASKPLRSVLATVNDNSKHVSAAVDSGINNIHSFFRSLRGNHYSSSRKALTLYRF